MSEQINVILAPLSGRTVCTTKTVYQYSQGMQMKIIDNDLPNYYRVEYANSVTGTSLGQMCTDGIVSVPSQFFVPGTTIHAWIVLIGETFVVPKKHIMIPISPKALYVEGEPEPEQTTIVDEAIAALNQAVDAVPAVLKITGRVSSLDSTSLAAGEMIHAIGAPVYVTDTTLENYAAYGLTEAGWYVFARITAPEGITVSAGTSVEGAAGSIITPGADHVDVAVRFLVAAASSIVSIAWAQGSVDRFVFAAPDLAVRNLDYRTTFYVYDLAPYAAWTYALTTDATFVAGKNYYTEDDGVYTLAEVTAGEAVPANTYYNHNKLTLSDMVKNVTYRLDEPLDCALEIVLPEINEDGHGAWFEFQLRHTGSTSITLLPPTGVKGATAGASAAISAGLNVVDLHYTDVDNVKMWSLANVHTNIPA